MEDGGTLARAAIRRQLAELDAVDAATASGLRMRSESSSTSVVFSVRLDRFELRALEQRALIAGIKPSVLTGFD